MNYYLDGGSNMTNLRNTGNVLPNPDAIQEFRVQTNSYNAEYGRFASGIINVLTKSGTNRFRGSLFEFVRNTVFNANDYASQLAQSRPFIATSSAARWAARSSATRLSFSFRIRGLRQTTSTFLNNAIVPTDLERVGNFSASGTKPTDPATNATFVCNGVSGVICHQSSRSGGGEDHQHLHSSFKHCGQQMAGQCAQPFRLQRGIWRSSIISSTKRTA